MSASSGPLPVKAVQPAARKRKVIDSEEVPRFYVDLFMNDRLVSKISENMTKVIQNMRSYPSTDREMNEIITDTQHAIQDIDIAKKDSTKLYESIVARKIKAAADVRTKRKSPSSSSKRVKQ